MRVISGSFKGRKLKTLDGLDTRPTTDKVKEAIFNSIQFQISGSCFLDLFAGSGQMGIEALSRGAKKVAFVEKSKKAMIIINKNLEEIRLSGNISVVNSSAESFLLNTRETFDIVFLDPPYELGFLSNFIAKVRPVMNKNSILIYEHSSAEVLPDLVDGFDKLKDYRYGNTTVSIFTLHMEEVVQ